MSADDAAAALKHESGDLAAPPGAGPHDAPSGDAAAAAAAAAADEVENTLQVEVLCVENMPKNFVHADAGKPPQYADCLFGVAFELRLDDPSQAPPPSAAAAPDGAAPAAAGAGAPAVAAAPALLQGSIINGRIQLLGKELENTIDGYKEAAAGGGGSGGGGGGGVGDGGDAAATQMHEPSVVHLRTSRTTASLDQYRKAAAESEQPSETPPPPGTQPADSEAAPDGSDAATRTTDAKDSKAATGATKPASATPDPAAAAPAAAAAAAAAAPPPAEAAAPGADPKLVATFFTPDTPAAATEAAAAAAAEPEEAAEAAAETPAAPPHVLSIPLTAALVERLQEAAGGGCTLRLCVRRILRAAKAQPDWEDVNEARYRAEAVVDLSVFSEPGATTHLYDRVAVRHVPPQDEARTDGDKKAKKPPPKKPAKGAAYPAFLAAEDEFETHPYEAADTCVCFRLSFASALVCLPQNRPRPDALVSDLLPPRVRPTRPPPDAGKAFCGEVSDIVGQLVLDYRSFSTVEFSSAEDCRKAFLQYLGTSGRSFAHQQRLKHCALRIVKEKFAKNSSSTKAEMEQFYNELYVHLLDLMHHGLSGVFSRDSLGRPPFEPDESKSDKWRRLAAEAEAVRDLDAAERYHQERLVQAPAGDPDAPAYEELPTIWGLYARFCLRARDVVKAEQALREAVAIDIAHAPSLVDYTLLLLAAGRLAEAEVYAQCAVDAELANPTTWMVLGLLNDLRAADADAAPEVRRGCAKWAKYARAQAARAQKGDGPPPAPPPAQGEELPEEAAPAPAPVVAADAPEQQAAPSLDMQLATLCADLRLEPLAWFCVAREKENRGGTAAAAAAAADVQVLEARLRFQVRECGSAVEVLKGVLRQHPEHVEALVLCGDCYVELAEDGDNAEPASRASPGSGGGLQADEAAAEEQEEGAAAATPPHSSPWLAQAEECYRKALAADEGAVSAETVVRLGNMFAGQGRYEDAADAHVLAARKWRCGVAWQGAGIALYRLGRYSEAETALNESNLLNNYNARTWTYIALLCLKQGPGRGAEADKAFHHALKLGLSDAAILAELGLAYLQADRPSLAEAACKRSVELHPSFTAHSLLGRVLMQQKRLPEAKAQYVLAKEGAETPFEAAQADAVLAELNALGGQQD